MNGNGGDEKFEPSFEILSRIRNVTDGENLRLQNVPIFSVPGTLSHCGIIESNVEFQPYPVDNVNIPKKPRNSEWNSARGFHHVEYSREKNSFLALDVGDSKHFGKSHAINRRECINGLPSRAETRGNFDLLQRLRAPRSNQKSGSRALPNDRLVRLMDYRDEQYGSETHFKKPTNETQPPKQKTKRDKKSPDKVQAMEKKLRKYMKNWEKKNRKGAEILSSSLLSNFSRLPAELSSDKKTRRQVEFLLEGL